MYTGDEKARAGRNQRYVQHDVVLARDTDRIKLVGWGWGAGP